MAVQTSIDKMNLDKAPLIKLDKEKKRNEIRQMRDKEREMVKGIFRFYECPGGTLPFVFRKYKEDSVEKYEMVDGQVYTVPLGVARHLNTNGWYPVHAYMQDKDGNPVMKVGQKVRRFGFQSMEFVDDNEFHNDGHNIITAELTGL